MGIMSRKGYADYPGTPIGVWAALDAICAVTGMRVKQRTDDYLVGDLGSQAALRIKGGMFAKLDEFPIEVEVRLAATEAGTTSVWVEVRDDFGFGSKFGAMKKYKQAIDMRMDDFVRSFGVVDTNW
jgi:hypothetical protein